MKLLVDMSSVMWTCLNAGQDPEGIPVSQDGKDFLVPTCAYGYENAVNMLVAALKEQGLAPKDMILVFEGKDSKSRRCMIEPTYKAGRGKRVPEAYEQFNLLKEKLKTTFRNLGAMCATQDFVEGDDVLAYIATNLSEDCIIMTNDGDMCVLSGPNGRGGFVHTRIGGVLDTNPYGAFDVKLVTLYKALVGDSVDNIKGCPGFGKVAWDNLLLKYDEGGCQELLDLISKGERNKVAAFAEQHKCKYLGKIVDKWDDVAKSFKLASLHPEWVNTVRLPLEWSPGMVCAECNDERLTRWAAQTRLVTADNYDESLALLKSKIDETPFFTIDFETTTDAESDDWLETRGKGGVDVIGSRIVSMGLSFGANLNHGFYISVEHAETNNCSLDQLAVILEAIPQSKYIIAHNSSGFELPVAYNAFSERWKNNGWRGFIPNVLDTRIAASFWDENQPSHGLKQLTRLLLDYQQATYEQTTTKTGVVGSLARGTVVSTEVIEDVHVETRVYKMHELTATEVVGYGVDDVYTAGALWNFFKTFMDIDGTYNAFIRLEQKPAYLSALAYVQGLDVDMPRLKKLELEDKELSDTCWSTIEKFLIEKGWDGVACPVFEELTPTNIKQAVRIVLGMELNTMVRTPSKLARLIEGLDHEDAPILAKMVEENRLDLVNKMVATRYSGKPNFNVGSPKQLAKLFYETIGMPIRLRNKATDSMRAAGIREGTPKTDDGAIETAIQFKDVNDTEAAVLKALLTMKSCNTRHGLYWASIPYNLHWKTGRLHPEVKQSSTNTRRWTSSKINIQQLESDPDGVRSIIKDGKNIVGSLDQSSQEVRLMAELSGDENLLSCYVGDNLRDTHSLVAHRIAKVSYEEFMAMRVSEDKAVADKAKAIRSVAKSVFFGYLFGAAAPKIAETLRITEEEAQGYIDAINSAFPGIRAYQEASAEAAETLGYVNILGGSKRHLAKLITSEDRWVASKATRQAGNARIQMAAANQIKTVMSDIWDSDLLDTTSFKWLFCVHDEVVISSSPEETVEIVKRVHQHMTKPFLSKVPSESSIGVGRNFGQLLEQPEESFRGGVFDSVMLQKAVDSLVA